MFAFLSGRKDCLKKQSASNPVAVIRPLPCRKAAGEPLNSTYDLRAVGSQLREEDDPHLLIFEKDFKVVNDQYAEGLHCRISCQSNLPRNNKPSPVVP